MNRIQRLVQRFGNAGALSNAAAELRARQAETALIDELIARVEDRPDARAGRVA